MRHIVSAGHSCKHGNPDEETVLAAKRDLRERNSHGETAWRRIAHRHVWPSRAKTGSPDSVQATISLRDGWLVEIGAEKARPFARVEFQRDLEHVARPFKENRRWSVSVSCQKRGTQSRRDGAVFFGCCQKPRRMSFYSHA
jgi:hypothetical protein